MTIIGFERKTNGSRNLLVFDPMFHDAPNVSKLVGEEFLLNPSSQSNENGKTKARVQEPKDMLTAYRRGTKYLRRYNEFEVLRLVVPKIVVDPNARVGAVDSGSKVGTIESGTRIGAEAGAEERDVRDKVRQKWGGK